MVDFTLSVAVPIVGAKSEEILQSFHGMWRQLALRCLLVFFQ